jgi:hypothetical protein
MWWKLKETYFLTIHCHYVTLYWTVDDLKNYYYHSFWFIDWLLLNVQWAVVSLYTVREQGQQYTKKPTQKRRRDVSTEATTFHCHCRSMRSLEWARHLVFCSDYIAPILFRNLKKRSLTCRVRGPLQTRYPLSSTVWIFVLSIGDLLSATL